MIGHDSPPGTPYRTGKSAERRHQLGHVPAGPTSPARPCLRRTCRSSGRSGPRRAAGTAECRNVVCSMFGEDALLPRAEEVDRRHGEGGQRLSHTRARAVPVAEGLRAHGRADPLAEPPEERRRRAVHRAPGPPAGRRGRPVVRFAAENPRRRGLERVVEGRQGTRPRVAPDGPSGPTSTLAPQARAFARHSSGRAPTVLPWFESMAESHPFATQAATSTRRPAAQRPMTPVILAGRASSKLKLVVAWRFSGSSSRSKPNRRVEAAHREAEAGMRRRRPVDDEVVDLDVGHRALPVRRGGGGTDTDVVIFPNTHTWSVSSRKSDTASLPASNELSFVRPSAR